MTKSSVTVSIEGRTLYSMFETNDCVLGGDGAGPACNGARALGLVSGGRGRLHFLFQRHLPELFH